MIVRNTVNLIRQGINDKETQKELISTFLPSAAQTTNENDFKKADETANNNVPFKNEKNQKTYKREYVWRNIGLFVYLHAASLYGVYLLFTEAMWMTCFLTLFLYICGGLGITAGAHRLWAHRSYKARLPLRFILVCFNTLALQNHVIEWARDHRVHHKHSETDADPHNAKRGFFFAHMGWLLVRKHRHVISEGKKLSYDDLEKDPLLSFQRKYYVPLAITVCFVLPAVLPYFIYGESFRVAYYTLSMLRYTWTLHMTWLVNSAAHMWGLRPFDKTINPSENKMVAIGAIGEGWHNYHHTFPYDYRTSELGWNLNLTCMFIDFMAAIGWAYDLKTVPKKVVYQRMLRTGDGNRMDGREGHDDDHHVHEEIDESEIEIELKHKQN